MYNPNIHQLINKELQLHEIDIAGADNLFFTRFVANATTIHFLFGEIYGMHPRKEELFRKLVKTITLGYISRSDSLKQRDAEKEEAGIWFLTNEITGMSLYVDRFCGDLKNLSAKLSYFDQLGVNFLHLMPIMETPQGESDGGYAVSDFRNVDSRFGTLKDLQQLREKMTAGNMYLMLDIVLNHTSHHHEWAVKAKQGDEEYQQYFYMYPDRVIPDAFEQTMPDIFPESSPGSFTYSPECKKWVMTVFHNYQWDLNFTNPMVFIEMLDTIFFYANLGVDILRIDAPAFIWKQLGTTCQNLPGAHTILKLIKQCMQVACPGTALLGEAIVAPKEIMRYFGTGLFTARECDFAYNATQMALQWDALATADTRVMLAAQFELLQKPFGTSWITYTRGHDDIGLGYEDYMIRQAGYDPYQHRKFLTDYYSGALDYSPAKGALFSVNPKTQDARISGSLASLCGLEKAMIDGDETGLELSIRKILMMQAQSFFIGGIPMLFYGDEAAYTNDYSYLQDPGKSYDNRWMHRPVIDWEKHRETERPGSIPFRVFTGTKKLIQLRKQLTVVSDHKNLTWLPAHNEHVLGFLRTRDEEKLYCIFNFSPDTQSLPWVAFKEHGPEPKSMYDHWEGKLVALGSDNEYFLIKPYSFHLLEVR